MNPTFKRSKKGVEVLILDGGKFTITKEGFGIWQIILEMFPQNLSGKNLNTGTRKDFIKKKIKSKSS